jgi:hypothetical protein
VKHASRSSGLLCLEASRARVFQSDLKTGGGVAQMVHMTSSRRSSRDQAEDGRVDTIGYIRPCCPYFFVFIVLGPSDILVFCLSL